MNDGTSRDRGPPPATTRQRLDAQELEQIIQEAPDGILVTSQSGLIEHANRYVAELFGYAQDELIGRNVSLLIPRPEQDRHDAHIAQLSHVNQSRILGIRREVRGQHRDGRVFHIDLRIMPLHGSERLRYVGLVSDITERKRLDVERQLYEEQLERQNAKLLRLQSLAESASRAKSEFLANISHEIRTPLTAILGFSELLAETGLSPQERWENFQIIRRNGRHLLQLINDVLDLSKIEAGQMRVDIAPCELRPLIEDLQSTFLPLARERGLDFVVQRIEPLPDSIPTDAHRLRQILCNLLSNALKFTPRGRITLTVECSSSPQDATRRLRLQVIDSGVGIAPDVLSRLFIPFTQADSSTTRTSGGTGLGLCISRKFARKLGGDITVTSQLGQGSVFTVEIDAGPLHEWNRPQQRSAAAVGAPADWPPLLGRALLAEDASEIRRLVVWQLGTFGLEVTAVEHGAAAVQTALASREAGTPFDVILMDMQMPVQDGYQATAALRESGWDGPIIALTAHALASDREQCLAAGCSDFVSKPIDSGTLYDAVQQSLSQRREHVREAICTLIDSDLGGEKGQ
jgi:PAS domain S-box-containing protein